MRLGYAYSRYPVLSQTFCDAEMLELERRGHEIVLASLYPPKTELRHQYLSRFRAPVRYAPSSDKLEQLTRQAKRRGPWPARLITEHERRYGPEYKAALRARNALFFAQLFERERVPHFHVHFANRAAHTALFVKAISRVPFSVTAHGQDFMSDLGNEQLLQEICRAAAFVAVETEYSRELLAARCPESAAKIVRVYNGIDLSRFPAQPTPRHGHGPIRLISVGRLVAFKGFDILLEACAKLRDAGVEFTCTIIGDGPLRESLRTKASELELMEAVDLAGERSEQDVLAALRDCDIFVLAATTDERGASDVFPTVIAEAMACAKPVVSTRLAGIPELVVEGQTGLLARPGDSTALAHSLESLIRNESLRHRCGRAGRLRIEEKFAIEKTIEPLLQHFERALREGAESSLATGKAATKLARNRGL